MAMDDRARIRFDLEDNVTPGLAQVKSGLRGVQDAALAVKGAIAVVTAAATAVALSLHRAVAEAREAEDASARLSVVLRNTGGAAGYTKDQIDAMAEALADSTKFDDESIRNAASEILKFGTIHGETFKEALKLSADVASFMGTDVVSAAQQVAKAMADPETATKLLKSAGVVLTEQQKDQIKAMGEVGDKAGQQRLILERLKGAYGGMAEEINTGLTRAVTGLDKAWKELFESIGKSAPVQATVKSSLGFLEQSLKDVRSIIDDGDWVEKLLAVAAFAGGWRGLKLTPGGGDRSGSVSGKSGGLPAPQAGESDADYLARKKRAEEAAAAAKKAQEEMLAREKRLTAEGIAGWVKYADAVFSEAEDLDKSLAKIQDDFWKNEDRLRDEGIKGWVAYAQTVFDEADAENLAMEKVYDAINKKGDDTFANLEAAVRGWGNEFTNMLADAAMTGELSFSKLANSVIRDLLRMQIQASITKPLFDFLPGAIRGLFPGSASSAGADAAPGWTSGADLPGFATGGSFRVGGAGGTDSQLVAFRASPDETVSIAGPGQGGGGAPNVTVQVINQSGTELAVKRQSSQFDGENYILGVVVSAANTNPSFRAALGMGR